MSLSASIDFNSIERLVFDVTGCSATSIDQTHRDEVRRKFEIALHGGRTVICSIFKPRIPPYIVKSEVATMRYIRDYTSIPVPSVLGYDTDGANALGSYIIVEKEAGLSLDNVLPSLPTQTQDLIVAQIARWTQRLSQHRFSAIGSVYADSEDGYFIGPIVSPRYFTEGRAEIRLNRGPFTRTREYLLACTHREIESARALVAQGESSSSDEYRMESEQCSSEVESTMKLMTELIQKCDGLDSDDPELSAFSIDMHELELKDFVVSEGDPTKIIAVTGWSCIATKPLWQCGRLPRWLQSSLSDESDDTKVRLSAIFRHAILNEGGRQSAIIRALESEDRMRCSLHDLCDYDAIRDGFLLRPTLQSMAATFPGQEDVDGLRAILDPSTVMGRIARISLTTQGSAGDALALAFSMMSVDDSLRPGVKMKSDDNVAMETMPISR